MTLLDTPLGPMIAVASRAGIRSLEFADRRAVARPADSGSRRHLVRLARELESYFAGVLCEFTVPLDHVGTPFQKRVWRNILSIPIGETRTYAEIARRVDRPGGSRAVGRANARSRLAILVPCHRIVRSDGSLCGYTWGLMRKRALLELEARVLA